MLAIEQSQAPIPAVSVAAQVARIRAAGGLEAAARAGIAIPPGWYKTWLATGHDVTGA